jgi:hypothetical protein
MNHKDPLDGFKALVQEHKDSDSHFEKTPGDERTEPPAPLIDRFKEILNSGRREQTATILSTTVHAAIFRPPGFSMILREP